MRNLTRSFDELRKKAIELEKSAKSVMFAPKLSKQPLSISISFLTFDDVVNELDKIYKIRAAKKYLTRPIKK